MYILYVNPMNRMNDSPIVQKKTYRLPLCVSRYPSDGNAIMYFKNKPVKG